MHTKLFPTHSRASFWGALLVIAALCGLYAPPSRAVAFYFGSATAELTITAITGGTSVGSTCAVCTAGDGDFIGNANSSFTGFADVKLNPGGSASNLAVGEGLSMKAEASGSASAVGAAFSFFDAFGRIDFSNSGPNPIRVAFQIEWDLAANATIDNPGEDAFTEIIRIEVQTGSPGQGFDAFVISDALFGPFGLQEDGATTPFSLTLGANSTDFVDIRLSAEGFAEALAVPEPGVFPLLALGLAGLGFFSRRRRHA